MPGSRILLTGAGGFVGRHLLSALRDRLPGAELLTPRFEVGDAEAATEAIRDARPDVVFHLAAVSAILAARSDPDGAWQTNLHGTLNLARAALAHVPGCAFLFAGTGDAYGASFRAGKPLDEGAALAPLNTYAATKAAADLALGAMAASEGLRAVRLRPFNHVGPGQAATFVVSAFARQAARIATGLQPPVLEVGALDPQRDFLDVRDVCAAYAECAARALDGDPALAPGLVLNLASGMPRRVGDVLDALLTLAGVRAEVRTDPSRLRAADIPVACGDASRAHAVLGWAPRIPWEETLQNVLDDWRGRVRAGE